jgi:2-haloacid dehalogenase
LKSHFIFVDVGDTILHLTRSPGEIYADLMKSFGINTKSFEPKELAQFFGNAWVETEKGIIRKEHADRYSAHPEGGEGYWRDLICHFFRFLEQEPPSKALVSRIYASFHDLGHWRIDPSVYDLIQKAKANDIGLGIISNWDKRLRNLLEKAGILSEFEIILVSGEFGWEKPSPKIFLEAQKRTKLPSDCLFYTGDKVDLDYVPPRSLGWRAALFRAGGEKDRPPGFSGDIITKLDQAIEIVSNNIDEKPA